MAQVTFAGDTEKGREAKSFDLNNGDIVFNAFENNGVELPHGCLSGSCGACKIEILEGEQNLEPAGAIENDTIEAIKQSAAEKYGDNFLSGRTIRLSCRAKIKGDVTFKSFEG